MPLFLHRLKASLKLWWYLAKESCYIAYGVWRLTKLPRPRVTIFGGSKISIEHPYSKEAMRLSQKLVENGISVITGGGPGIMQAANCGAVVPKMNGTRSVGIAVRGLDDEFINRCAQDLIFMNYFFSRKWLLTAYSEAFVIFPGGFGTLDELAEVSTLIQTKQMTEGPIVLIGKQFWAPLMTWVNDSALKEGLLKEKDRNLITVTDNIDEALEIVKVRCRESMQSNGRD